MILSQLADDLAELKHYPEFSAYYQDYVKDIQDRIIDNELDVNSSKLTQLKNPSCILTQLNELTEELKTL